MIKLNLDILLQINEHIYQISLKYPEIEYSGREDYPTKVRVLRKLINSAPDTDILETAAYYLKNIILLQAFADANHRTALMAVQVFLIKNNIEDFHPTADEAAEFQKILYSKRWKVYKSYEEASSKVLKKEDNTLDNEVFAYCYDFIKSYSK